MNKVSDRGTRRSPPSPAAGIVAEGGSEVWPLLRGRIEAVGGMVRVHRGCRKGRLGTGRGRKKRRIPVV
jgi:hypothetical protein